MLRAVSYSRVSSNRQVTSEGLTILGSLQEQKQSALEACTRNGWLYSGDYCEAGISAEKDRPEVVTEDQISSRPKMQALLQSAESGEFDILIFRHSDRLARLQHVYLSLTYHFEVLYGVQLYNLSKPGVIVPRKEFSPSRDNKLALERAFEALQGQLEQNDRVKKLAAGRKRQVEAGRFIFSPAYGYKNDYQLKHDKFLERVPVPDPLEYPILQKIFDLTLQGLTSREIAVKLTELGYRARKGNWSANSIDNILRNPFYAGKLRYGHIKSLPNGKRTTSHDDSVVLISHNYGQVISFEQFQLLAAQRQERDTFNSPRGGSSNNPLVGILKCGYCGGSMYIVKVLKKDKTYYHYRCSTQAKNRLSCQINLTPVKEVLQSIYDLISLGSESVEDLDYKQLQAVQQKIEEIKKQKALLQKRLDTATDNLNDGILDKPYYLTYSQKIRNQLTDLTSKQDKQELELSKARAVAASQQVAKEALSGWDKIKPRLLAVPFYELDRMEIKQLKTVLKIYFNVLYVKSTYDRKAKQWTIQFSQEAPQGP